MNEYRHILLVTDFSEPAHLAARRAQREARVHGARLTLLHVIEHFPVGMPTHWVAPEDQDPATYYRGQAEKELGELARELGSDDAGCEVIVTKSSAGHAIAEFAGQQSVDLIVAGIQGGWAIGMLGSTAMGIVHQTPCDVLLVR